MIKGKKKRIKFSLMDQIFNLNKGDTIYVSNLPKDIMTVICEYNKNNSNKIKVSTKLCYCIEKVKGKVTIITKVIRL